MEVKITLLKDYPEAMPSLAKIWRETLGQWFPEVQKEKVESWLHEWLNDNIPLAYIALDKDVPVGICSLQINDGIRPDLMPWLGDLCVDKTYQNQGIGKCLVEAVQTKAKEAGFDKLYLFAPDPSIPCYYKRLGWRKIGVDQYMDHTVTVMEIKL